MPLANRGAALAGFLVLAVAALAACGGSSKSSNAAATTTTGAPGARIAALRQCLARNGVNLPQRTPGQRRTPGAGGGIFGGGGGTGGGGGAGARRLPAGVTQAQFDAAIARCGGPGRSGGRAKRVNGPAVQAALVKFAACMRQNGIALPAPNTTGRGAIFNTSKLNTTSPRFAVARTKCTALLPAGFGRRPARPAGATGGA